jgi:hypothetical protein
MLTPVCNTYDESIMAAAVISVFTIKFFMYRENWRGQITINLEMGWGLLRKLVFLTTMDTEVFSQWAQGLLRGGRAFAGITFEAIAFERRPLRDQPLEEPSF